MSGDQLDFRIHWQIPEVLGELGQHHACCNICTIDGGLGCACALVGLFCREQRGRIMISAGGVTGSEDTDFNTHTAVAIDADCVLNDLPDQNVNSAC